MWLQRITVKTNGIFIRLSSLLAPWRRPSDMVTWSLRNAVDESKFDCRTMNFWCFANFDEDSRRTKFPYDFHAFWNPFFCDANSVHQFRNQHSRVATQKGTEICHEIDKQKSNSLLDVLFFHMNVHLPEGCHFTVLRLYLWWNRFYYTRAR